MNRVLFDTAINIASVGATAAPSENPKSKLRNCEEKKKQVNKAPAHCHRGSTRMNGKIHYSCMQRRLANSNNKEEPGDKNVYHLHRNTHLHGRE